MFSNFFIQRPRFAVVLALILMISGALCALRLPIRQYPNIAPPQVMVIASYPGADAQTVALTVGTPLEEAINGVENMLYYAIGNVSNRLKRIPGIGDITVIGSGYSVRIWLDPDKMSSKGLNVSDIQSAIRSQNTQAALGYIGTRPANGPQGPVIYSMLTKGRLSSAAEFEEIIIKRTEKGDIVRLKDVARIEMGADSYGLNSTYMNSPCAMMMLSQASNANALDVMAGVKEAVEEMKRSLPEDVEFIMVYDSTDFVRISIREIIETLFMTFGLVIFVCYLFLQNWRVTLVPTAAIPVSLLASFISLYVLGYSINTFTLFGLVLVIGTVVDDAICVVELVMYLKDHGITDSRAATVQAMKDVGSSLIATTLVFLAIFVPVAMIGGITGEIYKQFGVTMSFAVVCSTFVAFTLSPAICAHLLNDIKPKTRGPLAWFNKTVEVSTSGFVKVSILMSKSFIVLLLCLGASLAASWYIMKITPSTFIPDEDQGAAMGSPQLPEGASRQRTSDLMHTFMPELAKIPGIKNITGMEGYSLISGTGENVGMFIMTFDDWSVRKTPDLSKESIMSKINGIISRYTEASMFAFAASGIPGLGVSNGLEMKLQATGNFDTVELEKTVKDFTAKLNAADEIAYAFSPYTAQTPSHIR